MQYDVFISYSRKDTRIADQVCDAFDRHGISYFIDRKGISAGAVFSEILAEAIESSRIFLFLGSAHSYASKYTMNEVSYAFNEKPQNSVIPYLIDDTPLPKGLKFLFGSVNMRKMSEGTIDDVLVKDILEYLHPEAEPAPAPGPKSEGVFRKWIRSVTGTFRQLHPAVVVLAFLQICLLLLFGRDFFRLFLKGYVSMNPHPTEWGCNVALMICLILSCIGTLGILAGKKSCFYAVCVLDVAEIVLACVITNCIYSKGVSFKTETYSVMRDIGATINEPYAIFVLIALLIAHIVLMRLVLQIRKDGKSAWSLMR